MPSSVPEKDSIWTFSSKNKFSRFISNGVNALRPFDLDVLRGVLANKATFSCKESDNITAGLVHIRSLLSGVYHFKNLMRWILLKGETSVLSSRRGIIVPTCRVNRNTRYL